MAITEKEQKIMNNSNLKPEDLAKENEVLKKMILTLRNDASNAMTAASEFKARYEIAADELAELKKLQAAKPIQAKAAN